MSKRIDRSLYVISLFIFFIAAIYRMAILITVDTGPLEVFEKIRTFVYNKAYSTKEITVWNNLNEGINCTDCTGVWSGFILAPILMLAFRYKIFGIIIFALGGAGIQHYATNRSNEDELIV